MKSPDVSIVIVNYNTKVLLCDCLDSIFSLTKRIDFEVIVVDNASSDGSETYVRERFPSILWVNSGSNLGFGRANNLGVERAMGKYIFFLNSDTILLNDAVSLFFDYMESNREKESLGVLGAYLLDKNGNVNISCGYFPTPISEFVYLWRKLCRKSIEVSNTDKYVDCISGADIFIPRELFLKIGGFDPRIFMYYEETDLQYRLSKIGINRKVITGPRIIHLEGGSFKSKGLSLNRFRMAQSSYNYYLRKHYCGFKYFTFKLSLLIVRLSLFFTTDWRFKDKCKAYLLVCKK